MTSQELTVLAQARWPEPADREVPQVPGYVLSSFSPMVFAAADRCLRRHYRQPPAAGGATAVVLVSASGDIASANHVARTVDSGGRIGPLFFYQSVPNSIAGHVAARWGLGGPVVCLCPTTGDPMADGLAEAALLIETGEAELALVVLVEQFGAEGESAAAAAVLVSGGSRQ
ncbi:beta-ketoacyl synthase chain length factor [Actinophytocola sp.]|uniref:beta-ketoacyl synthase chain length factor n=1 Tax=Actinophytocola sp. TaxID=1872138 RepID=UPI002D7F8FB5|nr:beta-ketoacyl synthase chain length factor [Actinophytocola sp.]HET9143209.1 beta-ketoacyl synthase chain length factor [Actinophytocola sp.]